MKSETYRINQMGLKTKDIVRVASTQNFEDFMGFSVLNHGGTKEESTDLAFLGVLLRRRRRRFEKTVNKPSL